MTMILTESPTLSWVNVGLGFLFILFDAVLSATLGLGIGGSLVVAATRCVIQLSIMGLVLDKVFASQNIWGVVGIAREYSQSSEEPMLTGQSYSTSLGRLRRPTTRPKRGSPIWYDHRLEQQLTASSRWSSQQ
jgi:hypothetical protein